MYHFCTYFDRNYLFKGLALYNSLRRHSAPFRLWVLCLDDATREILSRVELPGTCLISLREVEDGDAALLEAKSNRSWLEYYFTLTPSLLLYVLKRHPSMDAITYLDGDLFFYSDPRPMYEEFGDQSILIIEHRFTPDRAHFAKIHGVYNVGLVAFRNDAEGSRCLQDWRARCLETCPAEPVDGRYGDQKYLEDWPQRFRNVVVVQHRGAGLAPWNVGNYTITRVGQTVMVDSDPLIFYHFYGFQIIAPYLFGQLYRDVPRRQQNLISASYIAELQKAIRTVRSLVPGFNYGLAKLGDRHLLRSLLISRLVLAFPPPATP